MLKPYHIIWLDNHPERSKEWLEEKMQDGFDIHHLDGDHENDDPSNLMLIETGDHMSLHNGGTIRSRIKRKIKRPEDPLVNEMISEIKSLSKALDEMADKYSKLENNRNIIEIGPRISKIRQAISILNTSILKK